MTPIEMLVQADRDEKEGKWELAAWTRLRAAGRRCVTGDKEWQYIIVLSDCLFAYDASCDRPPCHDGWTWYHDGPPCREGWWWYHNSGWSGPCDMTGPPNLPCPPWVLRTLHRAGQDAVSEVIRRELKEIEDRKVI